MPKRKAISASEDSFEQQSDSDDYRPSSKTRDRKPSRAGKKKARLDSVPTQSDAFPHNKSDHTLKDPKDMQRLLIDWFAKVNGTRGMPWRKPFDPSLTPIERNQRAYEVWVSEIMLQQTQVATVIPYYNRWMEKFPSLSELAAASIDEVNAIWKGLGYYSRASRLLTGAQKVIREYGGMLPNNAREMQEKIPGIGRYSAGAICSIAYGEQVPVLDGNVHRLLSRVLALHAPPKAKVTLDILWNAAAVMVQSHEESKLNSGNAGAEESRKSYHSGDINQALIELGSTICKVSEPRCGDCPLQTHCLAYSKQEKKSNHILDIEDICEICTPLDRGPTVVAYPMKAEKKKPREEYDLVTVVEWRATKTSTDRHFLLKKRPKGGLLAGLLEFPTVENIAHPFTDAKLKDMARKQLSKLLPAPVEQAEVTDADQPSVSSNDKATLRLTSICYVGEILHVFSHIRKTYKIWMVLLEGGECPPALVEVTDGQTKVKVGDNSAIGRKRANIRSDIDELDRMTSSWIALEDVGGSNTGVVKVWNLVKHLWESA